MLNLKKEADTLQVGEITLGTCPVCSGYVSHLYFMQDAKTKKQSKWYSCACGVVWQTGKPDKVYDKAYLEQFEPHDKKLRASYEYPVRIYAPMIEEMMYGRKVLLIGRPTSHQEEAFARRGWVPYSIDKCTSYNPSERMFVGDFETYEFPEGLRFNMIWLYHTLECFTDPTTALIKARALLTEDGIITICTPDTDFIHTRSSSSFIHWKSDMNYLMWNKRSLTQYLEKLGFNVIMARQNYERRFAAWDDLHVIAQRKFF